MDRSNSNSDHSNLFLISSDSSRGQRPASARSYARFAKKVRQLLEVEDGNLEQLYLKVETIVRKYFHQHQVIEFKEMYDCLSAIKTNSKKMNQVLNMLEKKLVPVDAKKDFVQKQTNMYNIQDFKTTTSSQKDRNSIHKQQGYEPKQRPKTLTDSTPSVNTSIKYNHIYRPSIIKDQINEYKQSSKYIVEKNSKTSIKQPSPESSPTKLIIKNDEYQLRNKQYESRVRKMMQELEQIKSKINIPHTVEPSPINHQSSDLRIELRQNEIDKQYSIETNIEKCDISKKSDTFSQEKICQQQPKSSNLSNNSSLINELSSKTTNNHERIEIKVDQILNQASSKKDNGDKQVSDKKSSKQSSLKAILQNTDNITRQIEQLKQVASKLQIDSANSINKGQSSMKSETSLLPPDKINQLIKKASEEKSKNTEILQKIQVTTSQNRISQQMIPSFKNLAEKSTQFYKKVELTPQFRRQQQYKEYPNQTFVSIYRSDNEEKLNKLGSSQVVKSFKPQIRQQPQRNISTIRYIYNPMVERQATNPSLNIHNNAYLNRSLVPKQSYPIQQIPIYQSQPIYRPVEININRNISAINTPSSNNSSTSIMHHHPVLSRHSHLHSTTQPIIKPMISNSISKIQPLAHNQANLTQSFYQSSQQKASIGSKQLLSSSSSQGSFRKKGLNIITSFDKKI